MEGRWGVQGKITRMYGLGFDNLLTMELLTFDDSVLKLDKDPDKDLFRAIRGPGGPACGIRLLMTFKFFKVPHRVLACTGW